MSLSHDKSRGYVYTNYKGFIGAVSLYVCLCFSVKTPYFMCAVWMGQFLYCLAFFFSKTLLSQLKDFHHKCC